MCHSSCRTTASRRGLLQVDLQMFSFRPGSYRRTPQHHKIQDLSCTPCCASCRACQMHTVSKVSAITHLEALTSVCKQTSREPQMYLNSELRKAKPAHSASLAWNSHPHRSDRHCKAFCDVGAEEANFDTRYELPLHVLNQPHCQRHAVVGGCEQEALAGLTPLRKFARGHMFMFMRNKNCLASELGKIRGQSVTY